MATSWVARITIATYTVPENVTLDPSTTYYLKRLAELRARIRETLERRRLESSA